MNGATQDNRKTNVQKLPNAQIQGSRQVFKGGIGYAEALAGKVLIGRSWSLAIYGKGRHHKIFLDSRSSDSERVPVFSFRLCPSPLVLWGGGGAGLGSGCSWRSKFSFAQASDARLVVLVSCL